jgi:hypothetical protein
MLSGLYYKHIVIVNDDSRVIRMTLQVVASPMIIILMILGNIYSSGVTYNRQNIFIVQATGPNVIKLITTRIQECS